MKTIKYKRVLGILGLALLLTACGGGESSSTNNSGSSTVETSLSPKFASIFSQKINSEKHALFNRNDPIPTSKQDQRFIGELKATNVNSGVVQNLDWSVTLRSDGTVESHGVISLTPGVYDFVLILERAGNQYIAQSLAQEIEAGSDINIGLTLLPNIGDTITDIDNVGFLSTMKFEYPSSDLINFNEPKFGMSLNQGDEFIFVINKNIGITEVTVNVEAGSHQVGLNFYEGSIIVGTNDGNTTINLGESEDVSIDIVPLQADVNFSLDRLVDNGEFIINIPKIIVDEASGEEHVSLLVRMNAGDHLVQEQTLEVIDSNGIYKASSNFETYGEDILTAYLAFYNTDTKVPSSSDIPYASCTAVINVESHQVLGCKLELKRNSVISGRLLSSFMLNVIEESGAPVAGAEVYLNGKLIGLTGDTYSSGSLKTHQVAGDYELKVKTNLKLHESVFSLKPLQVLNKVVTLEPIQISGVDLVDSGQRIETKSSRSNRIIADFNNNGFLDIFEPNSGTSVGVNGDVLWINDGQGNFSHHSEILDPVNSQNDSSTVAAGDLTGDGYLDLVIGGVNKRPLAVYKNDGKGNFTKFHEINFDRNINHVRLVDANGDGDLDLAVQYRLYSVEYVKIYINDGSSKFKDTPDFSISKICDYRGMLDIDFADINNNGKYDLVASCYTNYDSDTIPDSKLYLGNGDGSFKLSDVRFKGVNAQSTAIADLNRDGFKDIVIGARDWYNQNLGGVSKIFWNDGNGTFTDFELPKFPDGSDGETLNIADMNGDGNLDILAFNTENNVYLIYYFDGKGNVAAQEHVMPGLKDNIYPQLYPADLNGNDRVDVYLATTLMQNSSRVYFNVAKD
ncbi:FG-GAP repeat domain-containing protein [Vibrio cortegadensis]|uniref:FG-GAP repeat domain-containing protein n=1 Tax=Vibrio cortegadensis TaxID=1328770 RepID=A0ABV4MAZ4_9VIBR